MSVPCARRFPALLLAAGLALALAGGLAACGGSADGDPPPTEAPPATPEPPAAPVEATATAEPPVPEASTPTDEPASTATATPEPTTTPVEPSPEDSSAAPDEAEAVPLLYDTYDLRGAVAEPGHYVFLEDPDDPATAITTYEGLRTGLRDGTPIGLLIHQHDSAGTSQAAFYDLVEVNDVVEWREADGCWMRYVVTAVHPDPTGDPPRKLLTLRVYSYPYPYTGCSGAIRTAGSRTFTWSPGWFATGNLPGPVWHGASLIAPASWSGTLLTETSVTPLDTTWPLDPLPDPDLGPGWIGNVVEDYGGALGGFYSHTDGGFLILYIYRLRIWPHHTRLVGDTTAHTVLEYRIIDGYPAEVSYDRERGDTSYAGVIIYDAANGIMYTAHGGTVAERNDPDALIALALQFLPDAPVALAASSPPAAPAEPSPPTTESPAPEPAPLTFRYDTYDLSGAVAEPGHYAFLAEAADPASVVTTYEELRDGSTTALLIHTTDADSTSRADFYDDVEVGDVVEWREASDCFVRYPVTEVKDDPTGDPPRKLLAVKVMTYAFTGCSGAIDTTESPTITWSPANLQSPEMSIPIRHGPWQLIPEGWKGSREDTVLVQTTFFPESADLAVVRQHRLWREPDLPTGWRLRDAFAGVDGMDGIIAEYEDANGASALGVVIQQLASIGNNWPATTADHQALIVETRVIDGHPAYVGVQPDGTIEVTTPRSKSMM